MNILDSLKGLVTDELVSKAAGALGEDSGAISKVMQGAIPSVLGGLMGSNSNNHGALSGLFGQAAGNDNLMGDILGGIAGGGDTGGGIMDSLLSGIFGDKVGGIVNILTNLGGFKNSGSSNSILGIVGSLVASYFGKKMMKDGLDFGSILNMIGGEKDAIMSAAPEGMMDAMGVKAGPWEMVKDVIGNVSDAVTGTAGKVADGTGDALKGAAGVVTGTAGSVVEGAGKVADSAVEGAGKVAGAAGDLASGAAGVVAGTAGSVVAGAGKVAGSAVEGVGKVAGAAGDLASGAAGAVTGAAGKVVGGAGDLASGAMGGAKKGLKWLWPILLLAALAAGLLWFMKGCNNDGLKDGVENVTDGVAGVAGGAVDGVEGATEAVTEATGDAADAIGGAVTGALDDAGNWVSAKGEAISLKMEDGSEIATTKGSVIDKLYNFAKDPDAKADNTKAENWFNFEDVLFETGSATLKSSGMPQIANAAKILKAFPNLKIKIGGYTDNTGNTEANLKLSDSRAKAVYKAIRNKGASASSFAAKAYEGYGIEFPVASNDTKEGRAQNRRIACVVTEK